MIRIAPLAALVASAVFLAGCAGGGLDDTPPPMGRFLLGHNVAVAESPERTPFSREVDDSVWVSSVRKAVNDRFSRYDGDQYYHIAVSVLGYTLSPPGPPGVTPKSVLIADVSVFSDAEGGTPLNDEPKRFTVFEGDAEGLFLSGLTKTPEEQVESLSNSLSLAIHDWLLGNLDWFGDASLMDPETTSPGRPIQPLEPMVETES